MNECEQAYKDWLRLLEDANAMDLLKDPYNIWLEAWEQARIAQKQPTP